MKRTILVIIIGATICLAAGIGYAQTAVDNKTISRIPLQARSPAS